MLPIKSKESINWVMEHAEEIEAAMTMLNKRLKNLSETLDEKTQSKCSHQEQQLSAEDSDRVLQLNRHLSELGSFLTGLASTIEPALLSKLSDSDDPMADYKIETRLHYTLRESDLEWNEDSDNVLTTREEPLKNNHKRLRPVEANELTLNNSALDADQRCWLLRDLYEHSYGLTKPRVPLQDCLRLGEVWVDVIIKQQYWLNLDTGQWEKVAKTSQSNE